jgi:hypothetical protein
MSERPVKGRPLGIRPVYLQLEAHVRGLARLLSLALRLLTVMEYLVRTRLAETGDTLRGVWRKRVEDGSRGKGQCGDGHNVRQAHVKPPDEGAWPWAKPAGPCG